MSLNSGGLGKNNKTETLESFLLEQNIDIALIQETKLKKSIYLRSYKSINKKAYGSDSSKGGLSIIFKPYLKFFISEKLISNEDFMGINLFDLHIINCYGRHYDTKTKINYQKKFQEKLKKLSQQLKNQKLLIAGDFNLDNQQLNKLEFLEKSNLEILKNETSSRKRNIDHFISHSILFQNSTNSIVQTPKIFQDETNLSDYKKIIKKKKNKNK
ncbi:hypothetical protein M0812_20097 [Anaeramoeba flamelloides]|uniref:Endonuclease/exonuclease/phosphatase domain-containing protein n=1 Tax=Anaeramoeba flamelloides TaxID=1746091 RepID=A0AAV7YWC3_9EUKA|nr:hypothetical protein M0812_20097 [Anaeramoeba flamelloides]